MINAKGREAIEKGIRENFIPDNLHESLKVLESQLEGAEGDQRMGIEAFILGIKMALGKV